MFKKLNNIITSNLKQPMLTLSTNVDQLEDRLTLANFNSLMAKGVFSLVYKTGWF